jgi:dihydrofolate reductase
MLGRLAFAEKENNMRKITAGLFITLDGVVEAPGSGDTTLPEKRGWSQAFTSDDVGMEIMRQMDASDAMLLGRKTYDGFAAFWPSMPDSDPFAQRINNQTKYVVSSTLKKADWKNTTVISGNVMEALAKLKQQPGKNISISGSGTLVASLIQHDLLDELTLLLCPVVLGVGKRLFNEGGETKVLKLVNAKPYDSGMTLLSFVANR